MEKACCKIWVGKVAEVEGLEGKRFFRHAHYCPECGSELKPDKVELPEVICGITVEGATFEDVIDNRDAINQLIRYLKALEAK